jgi:hypothetical protein
LRDPAKEETFDASEEECAKACYYSKRCCMSFSTRPGKEGKKDLCLLDTIFENQVFETLVQKGSWNYHKLNISQSEGERKCRQRRQTCDNENNEKIIDGLRLRNRRRGGKVSKRLQPKIYRFSPLRPGPDSRRAQGR